jgi:hypothetical protein
MGKFMIRGFCTVVLVAVCLGAAAERSSGQQPRPRREVADARWADALAKPASHAESSLLAQTVNGPALLGPEADGIAWLKANQNGSGSWGSTYELVDTCTVIETLVEADPSCSELGAGTAWLAAQSAANYEYLARQISALAEAGGFEALVADLTDELLAARNPAEPDPGLPNWPEGGWGIAEGYETDCLTTALAMKALDAMGLNGGFAVNDEPLAAGATNTHEWDIPDDAVKVRLYVTVAGSTVRLRMKEGSPPGPGDPYFSLSPGSWLIVFPDSGLPFTPGHNYITIQSTGSAATYTMTATYETPTFDTRMLPEPLAYLREAQNVDGGWGLQRGQPTEFYTTLHVLVTVLLYQDYDVATELADGIIYLKSQQLGDGSFGYDSTPIAYITALAALNLVRSETYPFSTETEDAITALLAMQEVDGSWDQEPYDTALAVLALWDHNQDPTADAGSDQMVTDTDEDCLEPVTLDGTGSSDVDGTIESYVWTGDDVEIATGASPSVVFGVGSHVVQLTVTDDGGRTASDTVTIDIVGTGSPTNVCHCCSPTGDCQEIDAVECTEAGGLPVSGGCTLEACCMQDNYCAELDPACCVDREGTPLGLGTTCSDIEACCLPDDTCETIDPGCCEELGGVALGPETACSVREACCLPDGTCAKLDPICCEDLGGTAQGEGSICTDMDACCLPDGTCEMLDPLCCVDQGGTLQGAGSLCTAPEACCLPDDTCQDIDPLCCVDQDGVTEGPGSTCGGMEACCLPDDTCVTADALCCANELGGTPQGAGSVCTAVEACCLSDDTCAMLDPVCCQDQGGTPVGPDTTCTAPEACCLPDDTCQLLDPECCGNLGGQPQGAGTVCTAAEGCCLPSDECIEVDPECCDDLGGASQGPGTTCTAPEACCLPDDTCETLDPLCCVEQSGAPQGPGTACTGSEACCFLDDTCQTLDPECCEDLDGSPQGAGTACTEPEACCLPDDTCRTLDPECCENLAGLPQGGGTACTASEACCLPDDTCEMLDPLCCTDQGGVPQGADTTCTMVEACCLSDDTCETLDPLCCLSEGGTPQGTGTNCTAPQACCLLDDTCEMMDPLCCADGGGGPQGVDTTCTAPEACCLLDNTCELLDPLCCVDQGGAPRGVGSTCTESEACCLLDDTCQMLDPECCDNLDGLPQGIGTTCTALESCCLPGGGCEMLDPLCCDDVGGVPGFVSTCQGDGDENGVDDACEISAKRPAPWEFSEYGGSCEQDSDCWGPAETAAYCVPAAEADQPAPGACYAPSNRYVSIARNPDQVENTARRITLQGGGAGPWWVGAPTYSPLEDTHFASVSASSVYAGIGPGDWVDGDWPDVVHVKGCEIAPGYTYDIQAIKTGSDEGDELSYSEALPLKTAPRWGDIVSTCIFDHCLPPEGNPFTQPNIDDVLAVVNAFTGIRNAPLTWMDVDPVAFDGEPEGLWSLIGDVLAVVNAFSGQPYPGWGPLGCTP